MKRSTNLDPLSVDWYIARCEENQCALTEKTPADIRAAVLAACAKRHGRKTTPKGQAAVFDLDQKCPKDTPDVDIEPTDLPAGII